MKKYIIWQRLYTICIVLGFLSCQTLKDDRDIFLKPIDPLTQKNELSHNLLIIGTNHDGDAPESNTSSTLLITTAPQTATITSDNNLFIPFGYTIQDHASLKGVYMQIAGADNYWNIPVSHTNGSTYVLDIGVPSQVLPGKFSIIYRPYDTEGNIAESSTLITTLIPKENRCGNGEGFPRVEGNDGIVNRKYDMGDEPGMVSISYNMFTIKDRMDIQYNGKWILSTAPQPLRSNEAPPSRFCNEAKSSDGFVGGQNTFQFYYDPNVSREVDVYVSGCLQGGTAWYFDVECPDIGNTNPQEPIEDHWYSNLPNCPCDYDDLPSKTTDPIGKWLKCGSPYNDHYHYGATYEARWVPKDDSDAPGQQCMYDANKQLITSGIGAGSPDKDSPDGCGLQDFTFPDWGHIRKDVDPWEEKPCLEYLKGWPSNNLNLCNNNPITDILHMEQLVGNMTCDQVVYLFKAVDQTPGSSELLKQYFHNQLFYTPSDLARMLEDLKINIDCDEEKEQCQSIEHALKNLGN